MKCLLLIGGAFVLAGCGAPAGAPGEPSAPADVHPVSTKGASSPDVLGGTWDVSLYYSATDPPSKTTMVLEIKADKTLSGSFYGSPFVSANYSLRDGVLAFAVVTTDGKGAYNTSGRYVDGRIEGQTHSLGRDFLMIWTATRRDASTSRTQGRPGVSQRP